MTTAKQAITQPEPVFGVVFDHAPQPYVVTDDRGTIRCANPAARRFLRVGDSLNGTSLTTLLPVRMRRRMRRFIARLRAGDATNGVFDLCTAGGDFSPCRTSATLVGCQEDSEDPPQILWLLLDLRDLQQAEQDALAEVARLEAELARTREMMERANEELHNATEHKEHFLSMMSHELRTPLTVLVGGARILHARLENVPKDDRRELLSDMLRHGQRLQQLIENLMVLARGQTVELETLSLRRLLPNIIFSYQFADPGLAVQLKVPDDLPAVRASTLGFEQVMRNVLSNTRQHARSEMPVEIRARRLGGYVVVSLRDHGPGLSESELEEVFEPYRHGVAAPRDITAMGIGLTVSRKLMEAQHGAIWARRPGYGAGTVFMIALPIAQQGDMSIEHNATVV